MSKDEYLITDTPLKALTVFAMPMILGSFFQQIYNKAPEVCPVCNHPQSYFEVHEENY